MALYNLVTLFGNRPNHYFCSFSNEYTQRIFRCSIAQVVCRDDECRLFHFCSWWPAWYLYRGTSNYLFLNWSIWFNIRPQFKIDRCLNFSSSVTMSVPSNIAAGEANIADIDSLHCVQSRWEASTSTIGRYPVGLRSLSRYRQLLTHIHIDKYNYGLVSLVTMHTILYVHWFCCTSIGKRAVWMNTRSQQFSNSDDVYIITLQINRSQYA